MEADLVSISDQAEMDFVKSIVYEHCLSLCKKYQNYRRNSLITGWAVDRACCISQCSKYRKTGIFDQPWKRKPLNSSLRDLGWITTSATSPHIPNMGVIGLRRCQTNAKDQKVRSMLSKAAEKSRRHRHDNFREPIALTRLLWMIGKPVSVECCSVFTVDWLVRIYYKRDDRSVWILKCVQLFLK